MFYRIVGVVAVIVVAVVACSPIEVRAASPQIVTQKPCKPVSGDVCLVFSSGALPDYVRTIAFDAPAAGSALVTFNGTGVCQGSLGGDDEVADFDTQIVNNKNATVSDTGPGGGRFEMVLLPSVIGTSLAFNLASSRVFTVTAAGTQHYYIKVASNRLDSGVACYLSTMSSLSNTFLKANASRHQKSSPAFPQLQLNCTVLRHSCSPFQAVSQSGIVLFGINDRLMDR